LQEKTHDDIAREGEEEEEEEEDAKVEEEWAREQRAGV
jgi:hypothetical protein